jgi:hypothetical protein
MPTPKGSAFEMLKGVKGRGLRGIGFAEDLGFPSNDNL